MAPLAPPAPGGTLPTVKRTAYHVELDREVDGRWIAEVRELPGVMAYGQTKAEAFQHVVALALRVLADQVEHGERGPTELVDDLFAYA